MSGGWGTGWGVTPWGGFLIPTIITPPPPTICPPQFDIYCFCEGPTIGAIFTDPHVPTPIGSPAQFTITPTVETLCINGNGDLPANALLTIVYGVPPSWTFQTELLLHDMPVDFSDLVNSHVYMGTADTSGLAAGLFVSAAGLAYAGAVTLSSTGDLVLNGSFQVIPGTAGIVQPEKLYTYRLAADRDTDSVYIFVTESSRLTYATDGSHIGDQLIAVMPGIKSNGVVGDSTTISLRGTSVRAAQACFNSICLASGLYMPNVPPIANAGNDQALRMCTVGRLDGAASYDPDGGSLVYSWRFIDAPVGSAFAVECGDGQTVPSSIPTGFTNRFYSSELGAASLIDLIVPGDVLVLALPGNPSPPSIVSTGVDGIGYYVEIVNNLLPDNLVNIHFKVLRQRFLSTPTAVAATFFADIPGIYKFDLVVFDGQYMSEPATVIANVLESQVPKGCIPDLGFVWQYLSDFWNLVEDRERIQVLWESMAQVAAAELFTLWQTDYSKSLRDIQRTFQRRWLHYDLRLPEPVPDLTVIRRIYGGVSSPAIIGSLVGIQGTLLEITSTAHATVQIAFTMDDPYSAELLQRLIQVKLRGADNRYQVLIQGDGSLLILAPFLFQIGENTTTDLFSQGDRNQLPFGSTGVRLSPRIYLVDRSLAGLDIQLNDLVVIGGEGYRILRAVDDPLDEFRFQRIIVQMDLPISPGGMWFIPAHVTSKFLNFYGGLLSQGDVATFEVIDANGAMALLNVPVVGACSEAVTQLGVDLTDIDNYLSLPTFKAFLAYVTRRTHVPVSSLVVDIPGLQEHIKATDDGAVLRRNVDFFIEKFRGQNSIHFVSGQPGDSGDVWQGALPAPRLWAEVTYLDNNPTIEANFGIPAEFTLDQLAELSNDLDYLSAVRGLWYSYLNGPTIFNLRAGSQILLGLPFAEETGTVIEVRNDFSPTQGRILLQDVANAAIVRSYSFPISSNIKPVYKVGDVVTQLAPLVTGVEVLDYVNNPRWFQGLLNQGTFLEVEKFHKFMVRIDSAAFSLSALMFVMNFILRVKPTYTYPLFIVHKKAAEANINVTDVRTTRGKLKLHAGACFPNFGAAQIFDDYSSDGTVGIRNYADTDNDPATLPPVFPVPDTDITWGFDKLYLCPAESIRFSWNISHPGGLVYFDTGFSIDATISQGYIFQATSISEVPATTGYVFSESYVVLFDGALDRIHQLVQGTTPSINFNYVISVNGTPTDAPTIINFSGASGDISISPPITITAGDVVTLSLVSSTGAAVTVDWTLIKVTMTQAPAVAFALDTGLPAGIYSFSRTI